MLNEFKVNFIAIVTKEEIAAILNIRSYTYLGCHLGWMFALLLWVTDDQLLLFITCSSFPAPTVGCMSCMHVALLGLLLKLWGKNKSQENDHDK